eukprot:304072-Chlamydomonas_euryale.AAC.4
MGNKGGGEVRGGRRPVLSVQMPQHMRAGGRAGRQADVQPLSGRRGTSQVWATTMHAATSTHASVCGLAAAWEPWNGVWPWLNRYLIFVCLACVSRAVHVCCEMRPQGGPRAALSRPPPPCHCGRRVYRNAAPRPLPFFCPWASFGPACRHAKALYVREAIARYNTLFEVGAFRVLGSGCNTACSKRRQIDGTSWASACQPGPYMDKVWEVCASPLHPSDPVARGPGSRGP